MSKTKLYVGVDLHKRSSTWVALDPEKNEVLQKKCSPDIKSLETLLARLPAKPEEIKLALEPVLGWRWIARRCQKEGITVYPANPKKLKEIAYSDKKTDIHDARSLANLLRADYLPEAYMASDEVQYLRTLVRHRQVLVSLRTSLKCRIHAFCTAQGEHNTTSAPFKKEGREWLERVSGQREIKDHSELIEKIQPYLKAVEKRIEEEIENQSELKKMIDLLQTIPGVGPVSSAAIAAEVADFSRFDSAKKLASYAGLNPIVRASGDKKHTFRLSKQGSPVLRHTLIEVATRVRDKENSRNLYAYYHRMKKEHKKTPLEARIALAHKMLGCMYYMSKYNVSFNDQALRSAQSGVISKDLPGA